MNILITGAGYLTKATVDLLQTKHNCTVFSRTLGCFSHEKSSIQISQKIAANLNDEYFLEKVLRENSIQIVIHLAREKASSWDCSNEISSKNLLMTKRLLKSMQGAGVHHLIFASSGAVYGTSQSGILSEDKQLNPSTENGRDKLAIEKYLRQYANAHPNFSIVVLRFFNLVAGNIAVQSAVLPGPSSHLISQLAYAVSNGQSLTLAGDFQRDYLSYSDAAKSIEQSCGYLKKIKGIVCMNVGSGKSTSASEVLAIFERILAKPVSYEWANNAYRVNSAVADISLARKLLGFNPTIDLEQICYEEWRRFANV